MTSPDLPEDLDRAVPLRERFPEYLTVFGIMGVAAAVLGLIIGLFSSVSILSGVAYTVMMLGVVLLLAGGASGGGYTNLSLGAAGSLFGGRAVRPDDDLDDPDVRRGRRVSVDPRERLRKGLRPGPNPRAFWQVVGGLGYIAIGIALLSAFG